MRTSKTASISRSKKRSDTKKNEKPKKPETITRLKRDADKWHSLATRYRFAVKKDGTWYCTCITCGRTLPVALMQCGHFQSRRFNSTRYDEQNTAVQCYGCNVADHGQQYRFSLWINQFYGDGTAEKLYSQAHTYHKLTRDELKEIIARCKSEAAHYAV